MSDLANTIEGILFYEADALTVAEICDLLSEKSSTVIDALDELKQKYSEKSASVVMLSQNDSYQLVVAGAARDAIIARDEKEREGELSRAALETLSCILYLGSATKSQIDYIRGVQSGYMLRTLASRGLIARSGRNGRDTQYVPTVETLRFMGISNPEDMPDYENINGEFNRAINSGFNNSEE